MIDTAFKVVASSEIKYSPYNNLPVNPVQLNL
jgi:hypothetical protein